MSQQPPHDYLPQNTQPPFSLPPNEPYPSQSPGTPLPQSPPPVPQQPGAGPPIYAPGEPYYPAQTPRGPYFREPPPSQGKNRTKIAFIVLGAIVGFLLLIGIGIGVAATRGPSAQATAVPSVVIAVTMASTPVAAIAPLPTTVPPSPVPAAAVTTMIVPTIGATIAPTALSSPPTPSVVATRVVTVTDPGMINVRTMASTSSAVVTQMAQGDEADVIESSVPDAAGGPPWIHISYKGQMGYIRTDIIGPPHAKGEIVPTATAEATTAVIAPAANATSTRVPATVATLAPTKAAGTSPPASAATRAAGMPTAMITATPKR